MTELTILFSPEFSVFSRKLGRERKISFALDRRASIKDIIESFGVPHTEVGRIEAAGRPVDFEFIPLDSGRISIFPISAPFNVTRPSLLRPRPLKRVKFIADVNVGKLAVLLRIVGLDTAYNPGFSDADIAEKAEAEDRIVLSKDTGLLKRRQITFGRHVRAIHPDDQLREVVDFFGIRGPFNLFSRCLRCNVELVRVDKKAIDHRLEPKTRKYFNRFKMCRVCDRIYWQGSHHEHMVERLRRAGIHIRD